MGERQLAHNKH